MDAELDAVKAAYNADINGINTSISTTNARIDNVESATDTRLSTIEAKLPLIESRIAALEALNNEPLFIKKYNPGYYWAALYGGNGPGGIHDWSGVLNDLETIDNLNGLLHRVKWKDLEPSQGVYDFSEIRGIYNSVSGLASPKRLAILMELRSTSSGGVPAQNVPDYIVNNHTLYGGVAGNGGTWRSTGGAISPLNIRYMNLFDPEVKVRLKALSDAFAAEFNNEPYFEMLQFSEPIVGVAVNGAAAQGIPSNYEALYPDGLLEWASYTNTVFTKTIVTQLCNFPIQSNAAHITNARDNGMGVSCPNSLKDEPGLWVDDNRGLGVWKWLSRSDTETCQNVTVICPHIQKPECYKSKLGATGGTLPGASATPPYGANGAAEIIDLLKSVKANYAFITRAPQEPANGSLGQYNQNAIDVVAWKEYLARPHNDIKLNEARPSKLL